jgi:hypothetical protein
MGMKSMKKLILVIGVIFVIIILLLYSDVFREKQGIRITIFRNGEAREIPQQSGNFNQTLQYAEELFVNANDMLKLLVTDETITRYKAGDAVEIRYAEPREFTIHGNSKQVDGLLVSFVGDNAVIFYRMNGRYSSGPLANTNENVKEIRNAILNTTGNP